MALQIKHLYSETSGNRPTAEQVDVGQLWINAGDSTIGTKKNDGSVIAFAQLTEAERQIARNATPKTGQVSGITMSQVAGATGTDSATINDASETVLEGTLTANPFNVTISKTTGHKNTKLVLKKPAGITSSVVWNGVDLWLIGDSAPEFGDTQEEQELAVAIFTSPTKTAVNILYNTEHPIEIEATGGKWGTIEGNLADQADLKADLDATADKASLTSYATKEELSNYLTIDSAATTYLGISAKANSAGTADSLSAARTISLTGDATGSVSTNLGENASIAVTLANSGATAGNFGPSANTPVAFGGTFTIPSFTVDAKGRVTKSAQYTITLPSAPTTITGNASTATTLQTPRTITANLGSATGTSFDGSANVNIGVTGTLSVANGGTGASSPAEALTALGGLSNTGGTVSGNLTVTGNLSGASLNATSDRRLKNIISSASGINLNTLIPYRYTFKSDEKKEVHIGLIAQEVQKVVPEAVKEIDEQGHLAIEYNALVAILIDKVNLLEKRIAHLENNLQTKNTF